MGTSTERLRHSIAIFPGDKMIGRSRDFGQTCFLNSTHKSIKLTLRGYSRLYGEW